MMINEIIEILKTYLPIKLKAYHSLLRRACTGEPLEELISYVMAENGHNNDWQPKKKHTISKDITLENGMSFSVKSGIFDPEKRMLSFSGSRLGRHDTREDMVKSVIDNSADYYICVARVDQEWSEYPGFSDTKTYHLFVFPASALRYDSEWFTKYSAKGKPTHYMKIDGMEATIDYSKSYQLWTWVSTDFIGTPHKLDII